MEDTVDTGLVGFVFIVDMAQWRCTDHSRGSKVGTSRVQSLRRALIVAGNLCVMTFQQ